MRLVVFSDIHGNIYALEKFLETVKRTGYDRIAFLGDIFGYYYHQKEILSVFQSIPGLIWLKGNHDAYAVRVYNKKQDETEYILNYGSSYYGIRHKFTEAEMRFLDALSCSHILYDETGQKIGLFHGTPSDPMEGRLYPRDWTENLDSYKTYTVVLQGHTHWRMIRSVQNTLIINPGSLGQPRDGSGFGFAVVDTQKKSVVFHEVKIDRTVLYREIDRYDPELGKLKEVLERSI